MLRLTLRNLAANKARFAMTTFAVVLGVGFVVASFFFFPLFAEASGLIFGIVKLRETISNLASAHKELKTVSDKWVVVVAARQW